MNKAVGAFLQFKGRDEKLWWNDSITFDTIKKAEVEKRRCSENMCRSGREEMQIRVVAILEEDDVDSR